MSRPRIDLTPKENQRGCDLMNVNIDRSRKSMNQNIKMRSSQLEFKMERKRAGTPFNEMKRGLLEKARLLNPVKRFVLRKKKDKEEVESNYQNTIEYEDEDEDFSKYWSDYETWGYDKRGLGSIGQTKKKKRLGRPMNEMKRSMFKNKVVI